MFKPRAKSAAVVTILSLGVAIGFSGTAAAAAKPRDPGDDCRGIICLYKQYNYGGPPVTFDPFRQTYKDLPGDYVHNVGSFVANAPGCFIRWTGGRQNREVHTGDRDTHYGRGFGKLMEAVGKNC